MGAKVLSLFDGMACGMLAMQKAGIEVDEYNAYEIDKYAVKTATHNFPMIKEHGDVFSADFTQYKNVDYVLAGFPCTRFSIAQKNNRETKPYCGEGWDLFEQAWRAVQEAKPKYFLFENNKSMARDVQNEINKIVGFEPICINSALVSAQSRQRLYWVGKRNDDGTYSKVNVEQPEDKGILLKDVLNGMVDREKARAIIGSIGRTTTREYFIKNQGQMCFEPVNITTNLPEPIVIPKYGNQGKSRPINAGYSRLEIEKWYNRVYSTNKNKQQHDYVVEPVNTTIDGKAQCIRATCYKDSVRNIVGNNIDRKTGVAEYVYTNEEAMSENNGFYAIPVEFDGDKPIKAISCTDGKEYTVYEVKDGLITIKDKQYPIDLSDGYYIIRKLTVEECKRLQTVPEWYEFPVSDTQSYKMLGNGWTVDVIVHLIKSTLLE